MIAAISAGDNRQLTATLTAPIERAAEEEVEVRDAVAVQEGDPVPRADTVSHAGVGATRQATHDTPRAHVRRSSPQHEHLVVGL